MRWRLIPGICSDYEVSSTGKVRSHKNGTTRILAPQYSRKYLSIGLCIEGKARSFLIHRLVALAFIGQPPTADHQVNHKNGRRNDNRASNLEWVLPSANLAHSIARGLYARGARNGRYTKPERTPRGSRHWRTHLTEDDVRAIRLRVTSGERRDDLGREFKVSETTITNIVTRHSWAHVM